MDLQKQIAEATAAHEAELAARIAKLERESEIRALCPEGFDPKSVGRLEFNDTDTISYDVGGAAELSALIEAWHVMYGAFLPIGEYHKGCTTITAYPWAEYAEVVPKNVCPDAIEASNHAGKGFNSLGFDFYPNIQGHRVRVHVEEKFRANIDGFHGYVSANYNRNGDPEYGSIRKVTPEKWARSTYRVLYGSGSDDAANFCAVFTYDQLLPALLPQGKVVTS